MGWFTNDEENDHVKEQLKIYEELLSEKIEELEAIEKVEGSPEVDAHRQNLQEQIKQLELSIEQTQESAERAGHERETYEHEQDFFED